jgi:hypothetical protein
MLTALASALVSVQSSVINSPQFSSAEQAVLAAAPSDQAAVLSTQVFWNFASITTQSWYTGTAVPDSAKSVINADISALNSAAAKVTGAAPARATAAIAVGVFAAAGAVGVMIGL